MPAVALFITRVWVAVCYNADLSGYLLFTFDIFVVEPGDIPASAPYRLFSFFSFQFSCNGRRSPWCLIQFVFLNSGWICSILCLFPAGRIFNDTRTRLIIFGPCQSHAICSRTRYLYSNRLRLYRICQLSYLLLQFSFWRLFFYLQGGACICSVWSSTFICFSLPFMKHIYELSSWRTLRAAFSINYFFSARLVLPYCKAEALTVYIECVE